MFTGRYEYNLDEKGRLVIPQEYRKQLGGIAIINKGIETCISIYTSEAWEMIVEKLTNLPFNLNDNRKFNRLFLSSAFTKELDSQGRIKIDDFLIKYAKINKECIIIGTGNVIEIWAKEVWNAEEEEYQNQVNEISEKLIL